MANTKNNIFNFLLFFFCLTNDTGWRGVRANLTNNTNNTERKDIWDKLTDENTGRNDFWTKSTEA